MEGRERTRFDFRLVIRLFAFRINLLSPKKLEILEDEEEECEEVNLAGGGGGKNVTR